MWPSQRVQRLFSAIPKNKGTSAGLGSENGDAATGGRTERAGQVIKDPSRSYETGTSRNGILSREGSRSRRMSTTTLPHNSARRLRNSEGYRREYGETGTQVQSAPGVNSTTSTFKMSSMSVNFKDKQSLGNTPVRTNATMGLLALKALCHRDSLCNLKQNDTEAETDSLNARELEKLYVLQDSDSQKEELCKMMIRFVKDREKKYKQLLKHKAEAKLFTSPAVSDPKVGHILCIGGRTMCGKEIPHGSYPNSFAKKHNLLDLRNDPSQFKRFTAKCDLRGFKNEEISFTAEGNILKVCGNQKTPEETHSRNLQEEIILPPGVYPDSLRIARDHKGVLFIQEPWSYNQS